MTSKINLQKQNSFNLPFFSVRNISSPEDKENNRTVLSGKIPITSIIELPTDENVRDYLLDAPGKKRKTKTQVHIAIENTLRNNPQDFSILNGGVVIIAKSYEIDEKQKVLTLTQPGIINGSQTQGVIKDFIESCKEDNTPVPEAHITFELLVTEDEALVAETSIARNFQNNVSPISIVGRRGHLDQLETYIQKTCPNLKLRKSETDLGEEFVDTEKLIQVITALIPDELWLPKLKEGETAVKTFAYSAKAKCLKMFEDVYVGANESNDPDYKKLYQFYLDIASEANSLYYKWKCHRGFEGTRLQNGFKRDDRNNIVEAPDGFLFPIFAALSVFAEKTDKGWRIVPPIGFTDDELIQAGKPVFMHTADSNPQTMGKSRACYSQLHQLTNLYKKLANQND